MKRLPLARSINLCWDFVLQFSILFVYDIHPSAYCVLLPCDIYHRWRNSVTKLSPRHINLSSLRLLRSQHVHCSQWESEVKVTCKHQQHAITALISLQLKQYFQLTLTNEVSGLHSRWEKHCNLFRDDPPSPLSCSCSRVNFVNNRLCVQVRLGLAADHLEWAL